MDRPTKPSWVWTALAIGAGSLALVLAGFAWSHHRDTTRPVGEGVLFAQDAGAAADRYAAVDSDPDRAVRHLRNELMIEAVSLVDPDGTIVASSSPSLTGSELTNPLLRFGLDGSRLTALARTIDSPVTIDGVVEWEPGAVLYEVLAPLDDGALILDYDIAELLARRAGVSGVPTTTLQLLAVAAVMVLVSLAFVVGRARVKRRNHHLHQEAQLLRAHAEELEEANEGLREARHAAVEALDLAEEKNRIRAEFVLMINHELRTPLTAIVTGAELLNAEEDLEPAERAAVLRDMLADGRRLERLIAQMLEAARIENRGLSLTLESVQDTDVCTDAVAANPRIRHEPDDGHGRKAWTHRPTLIQLISSLADNAFTHGASTVTLQCTDEMPIMPDIEHGTRPADGLCFAVHDDGPGIDHDFLPQLFEKFEKRGFTSGTGLGLYLAGLMTDALHGSLAVATSPEGTTMVVTVPASASAILGVAA